MTHHQLNFGHVETSHRIEVDVRALDHLLPLLDAGQGPVPGAPGWHLAVSRPADAQGVPRPGAAMIQVGKAPGWSRYPVIIGIACWRDEMQHEAWAQVNAGYGALEEPLRVLGLWTMLPPLPSLPWVATWATPWVAMADPTLSGMLGDLERCVAWALIDDI